MPTKTAITEADILEELVDPSAANLSADSAHGLLQLKFSTSTKQKIRTLLRQNNRGTITSEDRLLLEKYLRVGQMLDLLHAKARLSLKRDGNVA